MQYCITSKILLKPMNTKGYSEVKLLRGPMFAPVFRGRLKVKHDNDP